MGTGSAAKGPTPVASAVWFGRVRFQQARVLRPRVQTLGLRLFRLGYVFATLTETVQVIHPAARGCALPYLQGPDTSTRGGSHDPRGNTNDCQEEQRRSVW